MSVERKSKYAVGDIVKLNAGGTDMTIKSQGRYRPRDIETYYFNGIYECL